LRTRPFPKGAVFEEQAAGLIDGGVDLLIIETAQDILEVKAAIFGARGAFKSTGRTHPIHIESETAASIARTQILPAAVRHLNELRTDGLEELTGEVEPVIKELHFALLKLEDVKPGRESGRLLSGQMGELRARPRDPGHGRRARGRRPPREDRRRRHVAAAEVLGDAVHQVAKPCVTFRVSPPGFCVTRGV
jgi:Homocysteine S-methyltransferase